MNITISIIIPVHRDDYFLVKLFESLSAQTSQPLEIIIVLDNLSTIKNLPSFPCTFQLIPCETAKGAASARNAGSKNAGGNYLFFLDSDVCLPPDIIAKVTSLIEKDPGTDGWIGSYTKETSQQNFASQFKNSMNYFVHQQSSEKALTFWGACGIIKREIFLKAGGFDERFKKSSVEDIELGYRLSAAGFRLKLAKDLQVKHQKKWTLSRLIRSDIFDRAIPWTYLLHRFGNVNKKDLNLKVNARISFLIVVLLVISFAIMFFSPVLGGVAAFIAVLVLLLLNQQLYLFFYREKGFFFFCKAILFHWLYYLYSGIAFIYASVIYYFGLSNSYK